MERGLKGFFYEYKYYLLPSGCESADDVKGLEATEVKRLNEEYCMAPDFVEESVTDEFLKIEHPERVFPATVNLYTRKEYDAILSKLVKKRCVGCAQYVKGGLKGHHREMSLDGVCYERDEEDSYPSFAWCVRYLWDAVAKRGMNELADLVDEGNQKEIANFINNILTRFFAPLDIYGGKDGDSYFLCLSAHEYSFDGFPAILKMIADMANDARSPIAKAGWKVYPYFPKGIYAPKLRPNYEKKPPIFYAKKNKDVSLYEVYVYEEGIEKLGERAQNNRKNTIYRYLCHMVGEDVFLGGCASLEMLTEPMRKMRPISIEELGKRLAEEAELDGEVRFPPVECLQSKKAIKEWLPFKENTDVWLTVCPELSPASPTDKGLVDDFEINLSHSVFYEIFGITYAYIHIPKSPKETDNDFSEFNEFMEDDLFSVEKGELPFSAGMTKYAVLKWYIEHADLYPQPITLPSSWRAFAVEAGLTFNDDGICVDYMVYDEKEFFRVTRNLTPVLQAMNAKIVTVKRDGVMTYEAGYVTRLCGGGLLN